MAATVKIRRNINQAAIYVILLIFGLTILVPFFWMISTAFKISPEIIKRPPTFLPEKATLQHFKDVFRRIPYFSSLFNSLFISAMTTIIAIFFSTMVGYALAKFRCAGLNVIFILILTALMIPPFIIAIPLYIVASQVGLVNSYWGVIIPFSVSNFGIFLMRQFCVSIPEDLLAAARIDGASELRILLSIVFPAVASGVAALGILKFLMTWNDFFWPLIMLTKEAKMTLQVMLSTLIDFEYYVDYGLVMAATTLTVLPVIILFLFFQRRIIEGVTISGMKG
jgi:ABC-type glycerol-3-phosphate transport system permease component